MSSNTLSNVHLVTIAVGNLGGHEKQVDSEDIAVHVNQLAPGKFSWKKYPEYIDLQVVNQALQDARRERNGGLVLGSSTKGWMLSEAGLDWINSLSGSEMQNYSDLLSFRRGSLLQAQEIELDRLYRTKAYSLYQIGKSEDVSLFDFYKFVKINQYFPARSRRLRFSFVESVVNKDAGLQKLWGILKDIFAKEFE